MLCGPSLASLTEYGPHDPDLPVTATHWPAGVAELVNREGRTGGMGGRFGDSFWFAGDAEAFNRFVRAYAELELTQGHALNVRNMPAQGGWSMHIDREGRVTVQLMPGSGVDLEKVAVPQNVRVRYVQAGKPLSDWLKARAYEAIMLVQRIEQERERAD
jgi:hypothetical protein